MTVGILTVSDRCSQGLRADESGPSLRRAVERRDWQVIQSRVVPDEEPQIEKTLLEWCDRDGVSLILTTGGTGLSPRDVTPEATRKVLNKELPGFSEFMRSQGLRTSPMAILSRALAGSRKQTLIINLPGSPKGTLDSLSAILDLIPHALATLAGAEHPELETHHDHA
ncbi:MAG: MogA/MoaB family molybdenum cofactor biosynthesis protein [Elusimicrobia bacterium]|nr:MogA/MoaB family molybdenum cofactor biosynthesis protein [Elusimicrobiota bacterium]